MRLTLRVLIGFICIWMSQCCCAQIIPIKSINILEEGPGEKSKAFLPYFFHQSQSGLVKFNWELELPEEIKDVRLPALLIPQPVQGVSVWLGEELIFEVAGSNNVNLRNWYRPMLISIPKSLIDPTQKNVLRVQQSGHLRGWFVAPMFAGDLADLRILYDGFLFLSQTLSVTINAISALMGIFLIYIGLRVNQIKYLFGGLATLTWSLLFTLALANNISTDNWFLWRLTLYLLTGWVIGFVTLFMFEIFEEKVSKLSYGVLFGILNFAWLAFVLFGHDAEANLDLYWTLFSECVYGVFMTILVVRVMKRKFTSALMPFFMHAAFSFFLAVHDYFLQAGGLPVELPLKDDSLWMYVLLQPIYLTHLAVSSFSIMALWMLSRDHLQKARSAYWHERQLRLQRERLVADIHDGVGGRINLLLWGLRSDAMTVDGIELELQRCMDELRFTINPIEAGYETLHMALTDLCNRLNRTDESLRICYTRIGMGGHVNSDMCLQLYKVAQECLSNALRHGKAKTIALDLIQTDFQVHLSVKDNGVGIKDWDEAAQRQRNARVTSLGLEGIKQRMQRYGGKAHISSSHQGTTVKCSLALGEEQKSVEGRQGQ